MQVQTIIAQRCSWALRFEGSRAAWGDVITR